MARSKQPSRKEKDRLSDPDWGLVYKFAIGLEKGRFSEYIELLQDTKKLLWKSFLTGLAKGFGAVVGATLVVAVLLMILGLLGKYLPGEAGAFFTKTGNTIEESTTGQP